METVEVVIRIPKDLFDGIECRNGELETEYVCDKLMKAIDNGTILPKGHGRLVDADAVMEYYTNNINCIKEKMYAIEMLEQALESRTVIEANKGE